MLCVCSREIAEAFRTQILNDKDASSSIQTPVRTLGSCTFMYLRHSDIYILCITKNNPNVMLGFSFMTSVRKQQQALRSCLPAVASRVLSSVLKAAMNLWTSHAPPMHLPCSW